MLYSKSSTPILPEVVSALTESLGRMPDETLCQAALRFVLSRKFMTAAMPGMFQEFELDDNLAALDRHLRLSRAELDVLNAARRLALATDSNWLPRHYRWLDHQWQA